MLRLMRNILELQMFPRGENLPRSSSICSKSHCGPATAYECTAEKGGPFTGPFWTTSPGGVMPQNTTKFCPHDRRHAELQAGSLSASNRTPVFNTSLWYLWGIEWFLPSLLPHWAWATAKLSWTYPTYQGAFMFQNRTSAKKKNPLPNPSPHQLLSCY